jgi:Calcineurin-like phosphoesterase
VNRHRHPRQLRRRRLIPLLIAVVLLTCALTAGAYAFWPSSDDPPAAEPSHPAPTSVAPTPTPAPTTEPTPSASNEPEVRIAIAGDTGTRDSHAMATARRIRLQAEEAGAPYDALLLLGDIVYESGDADLTKRSVLDPFGSVAKGSDLIPVLGNHDVKSDEQTSILRQLGRTTSWYVQRVGPVRVIVLNSTQIRNREQLRWLRGVLAEKQPKGTWTIAAMHHAPFSSGYHGSDKDIQRLWVPLFVQAHVPLVLAGHDHDYERTVPQDGVTYVVSGAAAKLRKVGRSSFTAVSATTRHFTDMVVYHDRLELKAIDQAGGIIDTFTIKREQT